MAAAAAAAEEVIAAGGEEEAAGEGIEEDSAKNASSGGVDVPAIIKAGFGLASAALSLAYSAKRGKEQREDIRRNRLMLGLLTPKESRKTLVLTGQIPAYYSDDNIRELLRNGKTPYGWTPEAAVAQGYGGAVAGAELRVRRKQLAAESRKREQLRQTDLKLRLEAEKARQARRTASTIRSMRQAVG